MESGYKIAAMTDVSSETRPGFYNHKCAGDFAVVEGKEVFDILEEVAQS